MPKAIWNGEVIAESDDTVVVEGNHYFPADALRADVVADSDHHTFAPGRAPPATTTWSSTGSGTRGPSGTTPTPSRRPGWWPTGSPSGGA